MSQETINNLIGLVALIVVLLFLFSLFLFSYNLEKLRKNQTNEDIIEDEDDYD